MRSMQIERGLGAASTTWNDYLGTAAADDADAFTANQSLYALADLDRDRWVVVAVDLAVRSADPEVIIYAIDRQGEVGSSAGDGAFDIDAVVDAHGHVPVTAVRLAVHDQVEAFLNDAFRRVAVRLIARGFRDETLVVERELSPSR